MSAAASAYSSPIGYVIECRGAWVRAQIRSVASLITVTGCLDGTNTELLLGHLGRFTTLGSPLIVDLNSADITDSAACARLVSTFSAQCRRRGIAWALVAQADRCCLSPCDEQHVVRADSVAEALQHVLRVIPSAHAKTCHWPDNEGFRSGPIKGTQAAFGGVMALTGILIELGPRGPTRVRRPTRTS